MSAVNPKDRAGLAKPNLSRIPFAPLMEVICALEEGARKYGPWNWRSESINEQVYADAAIRHLMQWLSGEDVDPDSGINHISKAIAGLIILRDAQMHNCSIDTRTHESNLMIDKAMLHIAAIHERYPQRETPDAQG